MRLRITVKRHGLPETPIIWNVDLHTATIAQLLEQVNEIVPIETSEWGLEDYAVELTGSKGASFECLHFQQVGKVLKEDDEVLIRPLLAQDLKIRKISGRHQISADGKHLVDGLAFGRPLLRRPADRPCITIPPRKRRRITYDEGEEEEGDDDDDDEETFALEERKAEGKDSEDESNSRQLVLHANFEDDDSEDDEDFVPGEDEEFDDVEDAQVDEAGLIEYEAEQQEGQRESATRSRRTEDEDNNDDDDAEDSALAEISDEDTRTKTRKLHSAFPTSPIAVCIHVLDGSGGDVCEAYTTMSLGFLPAKPKSAVTEDTKASLSVPNTRSQKRKASAKEVEAPDSVLADAAETEDSLMLDYYDQNGLPLGSISSGKALLHMAEALKSSPGKSRQTPQGSDFAFSSGKSVKFSLDHGRTNESLIDDSDEESEVSSSEATSSSGSSGSSSSNEDSSSSDESEEDAEVSDSSSSGSDSDSSSESSSDDDAPEETSSKVANTTSSISAPVSTVIPPSKPASSAVSGPGQGTRETQMRNQRRKKGNALSRFKKSGILPAGTTLAEFMQLSEVTSNTSPEDAISALEAVRAGCKYNEEDSRTVEAAATCTEFEARRQKLLASLESGGIEVGPELSKKSPKNTSNASSGQAEENTANTRTSSARSSIKHPQDISNAVSKAPETHQSSSLHEALQNHAEKENEKPKSQMLPKTATPQAFTPSSKLASPSAEIVSRHPTPSASAADSKPNTPAPEHALTSATAPRRTKLDVGAGRRMLFGALGLKAPKSKQDEEKVRSELMKDVRPIHTSQVVTKDPEEFSEDEDSEAWREKINYRAVECCHDGIELSEPPFPFVQRWDPQQQGGWSQKAKNGGKRKKNQRDDSQYYQEERPSKKQKQRKGKYTYADQQEYLDASNEPNYQEDSIIESQHPSQQARLSTDDIEGELTQQLMNDLNEDFSAQVSQDPEDLASLPEDPAILSDLKDGQAKPGMTIAFKQLTMSEETKWQPEISAYRTAVVNAILDDGELQITLALRDRSSHEKFYDAETGERIYGRFDMPDQDDEAQGEDDGILNLTFSELVEPKIVQDAPADLAVNDTEVSALAFPKVSLSNVLQTFSHEDEPADKATDAPFSHVTETLLDWDSPESNVQNSNHDSIPNLLPQNAQNTDDERNDDDESSIVDNLEAAPRQDLPKPANEDRPTKDGVMNANQKSSVPNIDKGKAKDIVEDNEADEAATFLKPGLDASTDSAAISISSIPNSARLKISEMMKDAGFRSSVPSSVLKDIRSTGMESPGDTQAFEKLMKDMAEIENNGPYSPKFYGLDSSSPIKKLKPISADGESFSSQVRAQSSRQTINSQSPTSSFSMNDEEESSWVTMGPEEVLSPPVKVLLEDNAKNSKSAQKFKVPNLRKAQELWAALQPHSGRSSVSSQGSKASPGPTIGLDGAEDASVQYPKLSVGSSFISQISDHGRQPDLNFDDSAGLSGDTPKAPALEDDSMSDVPSHKSATSSNAKQPHYDHMPGDPFLNNEESKSVYESKTHVSAKPRSKSPNVLQGSPATDDDFPTLEEVLSQQDTTREKTAPVRSKHPANQKKAGKMQKRIRHERSEDNEEEITPKASQNRTNPSRREHSVPSGSQVRKSRRSKVQGTQPQVSQSQRKFVIPQGSQVMDLTISSSDIEEQEDAFQSEVEQLKRFRSYALDEDDDEDYSEAGGRVPKTSRQESVEPRRQTSVGLKASSQSSLNTSRRKTTARV